jgi:hypothetical protein
MGNVTGWISIDDCRLWERNPNLGDVPAIKRSIQEFGFRGAIALWQDNFVMGGNHSVMALRQLRTEGWEPWGSAITATWEVPYIDISDLDRKQAESLGLAFNRTARLGHDDDKILAALLADLESDDNTTLQDVMRYTVDEIDRITYEPDDLKPVGVPKDSAGTARSTFRKIKRAYEGRDVPRLLNWGELMFPVQKVLYEAVLAYCESQPDMNRRDAFHQLLRLSLTHLGLLEETEDHA